MEYPVPQTDPAVIQAALGLLQSMQRPQLGAEGWGPQPSLAAVGGLGVGLEQPVERNGSVGERGEGVEYVAASPQIYLSISDAARDMSRYSGLSAREGMVLNNTYKIKRAKPGLVVRRYRCPYARRKSWKSCSFTMAIQINANGGFMIVRQKNHPPHVQVETASTSHTALLCSEAKTIVADLAMSGSTARATLRRLREKKLALFRDTDRTKNSTYSQWRKAVYNERHRGQEAGRNSRKADATPLRSGSYPAILER
ncbi:hypothetical protein FOZ60_003152 [Perkinsus olseni]|uniref:Uncharacterized protein n=1 Tax=Perkinsus olseni TaxID=32597 RepID=A0A7J6NYL9_PEROL|nr:hypothetical protein FOZ60_003152 [Perkinsus olseni]